MFSLKAKDRILEAKQLLNCTMTNLALLTSLMSFQAPKKTEIQQKFETQLHILETLLSPLAEFNLQQNKTCSQIKIRTISSDLNYLPWFIF